MAEDKRKKILAKAKQVIAKKGYTCASIKEIAKKAGVAQGTPYLYFKNKEELFIELILSFEKDIDSVVKAAVNMDADFWGRIEYIIRNTAKYFMDDKMMMCILKREMPEPLGIGRKGLGKIKEMRDIRTKKMQQIFADIKGNTELNKNFSDDEMGRVCMMVVFGMMKSIEHGEEPDPEAAAELTIKCLKETLKR
ncbi:MAG: helix-turn-helix domain-containing protein [Elusimicrobiota bacterium]